MNSQCELDGVVSVTFFGKCQFSLFGGGAGGGNDAGKKQRCCILMLLPVIKKTFILGYVCSFLFLPQYT